MTTKTFRPKPWLLALSCALFATSCTLKKPDTRETEEEIRMKEGLPLSADLHGAWTLDPVASEARIRKVASDDQQLGRWMNAYQQSIGSSMIIDAETIISKTPKGDQTFEAALLDPREGIIGIEAYRTLVTLRLLEVTENTLRMASETNPMMEHYIWVRQ